MFSWSLDLWAETEGVTFTLQENKAEEASAFLICVRKKQNKQTNKQAKNKNNPPPIWILLASCAQSRATFAPPVFHLNSQSPSGKTRFLFSDAN